MPVSSSCLDVMTIDELAASR